MTLPIGQRTALSSRALVALLLDCGGRHHIHGHGTGKLKAAVREALKGHPGIAKVEDAPQAQGGAGATVISLR